MMKRLLTHALALAFTAGAAAAHAVTWGVPDEGEHPHVGTLLFVQNGVGYFSCTGTMISPRVMLTAGHCVAGADADGIMRTNDVTYVRFEDAALSGISNYPSTQAWLNAEWILAESVAAHPLWADYAEFPATYDIGVVILSADYVPRDGSGEPVFGELPELEFLSGLKGRDRQDFTAVGYGRQGTLPPFARNDYEKYKGTVRLLEAHSYLTDGGNSSAKFSNNPGIGGGTCYGDSGGPTFFADTEIVVSVTSFGWAKNGNCVGNDFNYRTDILPALDFLSNFLD